MKQLLLLLLVLYTGINHGQERVLVTEELRAKLNDSLFSHFYMGESSKQFFDSGQKRVIYDSSAVSYEDDFTYNLFISKEMGSESVYDTLLDFAKQNAIEICDVNDTSLFVLVPIRTDSLLEGIDLMIDFKAVMGKNFKKIGHYPIPVVEDIIPFWDIAYTGWDKDMKLYVLAAGAGKYAEDCYLYNKKGELPPEWEHGYSRGMAINEKKKEVYYWLVIW